MYKIAVMGDQDSIYGFAALGLVPFSITDPQAAERKLRELAEGGDYGVIFITEALAAKVEAEIDRHRTAGLPAIILIPGASGNTGQGLAAVKKSVEQAVGSDIYIWRAVAPAHGADGAAVTANRR